MEVVSVDPFFRSRLASFRFSNKRSIEPSVDAISSVDPISSVCPIVDSTSIDGAVDSAVNGVADVVVVVIEAPSFCYNIRKKNL